MKTLVIKNSESFLLGLDNILRHFIYGMEDAGSEIEVVNIRTLDINPCRVCTDDPSFYSDGKCDCDDDMQLIYPKMRESENVVIATPFTGVMQNKLINFLDRLEPLFTIEENVNFKGNLALIGTSTKWDVKVFAPLVQHIQEFSPVIARKFAGAVLRPHSLAYDMDDFDEESKNMVNQAAEELGKSFIQNKIFDQVKVNTVAMQLAPYNEYQDHIKANIYQD